MTYSIVAADRHHLGAATASHWLGVGSLVLWCEAGVGAVVTQAFTEPAHGPRVLDLLRAGGTAPAALAEALADDAEPRLRQVAALDTQGRLAHHTGAGCFPETATAECGTGVALGNMLAAPGVPQAMLEAFAASEGELAVRLVDALAAGEASGGDARGRQAAALQVVERGGRHPRGSGTVVDLRVDDDPHPVGRLRELLRRRAWWAAVPRGDTAEATPDLARLAETAEGEARSEAALWLAVSHLRAGRRGEAQHVLRNRPALFALALSWARFADEGPAAGDDGRSGHGGTGGRPRG